MLNKFEFVTSVDLEQGGSGLVRILGHNKAVGQFFHTRTPESSQSIKFCLFSPSAGATQLSTIAVTDYR